MGHRRRLRGGYSALRRDVEQATLLLDAIKPGADERVTRSGKGVRIAAHFFTQRAYIDFQMAELVGIAYQPFFKTLRIGLQMKLERERVLVIAERLIRAEFRAC